MHENQIEKNCKQFMTEKITTLLKNVFTSMNNLHVLTNKKYGQC